MPRQPQPSPPDAADPNDPSAELAAAERAILGAVMLAPAVLPTLHTQISAADFYEPRHTTIYRICLDLAAIGSPCDHITVAAALAARGELNRIGGGAYLHTCVATCPTPANAGYYAAIIRDAAAGRSLDVLAARIHHIANTTSSRIEQLHAARTLLDQAITSHTHGHNGRRPDLTPASTFRIKPVHWLWENRMPLGEISLISGREGVGKSIYLAWLAAAITNGNLPGEFHGQRRAILYAATEDSWEYTIAPRMLAAGADLDRIYRIDMTQPDGISTAINLPRDLAHLADAVDQVDAAALMCDPLLSIMDETVNMFKAREVRAVLQPLKHAAETAGISVIGLVHYNKGRHTDSNSMIANTRAFVEVARAVIATARDDDADQYTVIVSQTKNNLGVLEQPNLAYTIDSVALETDEGSPAHVGRLRWLDQEPDITADQLLTGTTGNRPLSENSQTILDYVLTLNQPASLAAIADYFQPHINYRTVQKALSRLVSRGQLVSPARGLFAPPDHRRKTGSPGRNNPRKRATPPTTQNLSPPSPPPPHTHTHTGRKEESIDEGGVYNETQETLWRQGWEKDQTEDGDTRDTETTSRARTHTHAHVRAREEPPPDPATDPDTPTLTDGDNDLPDLPAPAPPRAPDKPSPGSPSRPDAPRPPDPRPSDKPVRRAPTHADVSTQPTSDPSTFDLSAPPAAPTSPPESPLAFTDASSPVAASRSDKPVRATASLPDDACPADPARNDLPAHLYPRDEPTPPDPLQGDCPFGSDSSARPTPPDTPIQVSPSPTVQAVPHQPSPPDWSVPSEPIRADAPDHTDPLDGPPHRSSTHAADNPTRGTPRLADDPSPSGAHPSRTDEPSPVSPRPRDVSTHADPTQVDLPSRPEPARITDTPTQARPPDRPAQASPVRGDEPPLFSPAQTAPTDGPPHRFTTPAAPTSHHSTAQPNPADNPTALALPTHAAPGDVPSQTTPRPTDSPDQPRPAPPGDPPALPFTAHTDTPQPPGPTHPNTTSRPTWDDDGRDPWWQR